MQSRSKSGRLITLLLQIAFALMASDINAQTVHPKGRPATDRRFTLNDIREINASSNAKTFLSPDGRKLAFSKPRSREQGDRRSDLFVMDLITKVTTRITDRGHNHDPVWSPDGKKLAFYSMVNVGKEPGLFIRGKEDKSELHVWDSRSGGTTTFEDWQLATLGRSKLVALQWSPDSLRVYVPVLPKGIMPDPLEKSPEATARSVAQLMAYPEIKNVPNVNNRWQSRFDSLIMIGEANIEQGTMSAICDSGARSADLNTPGGGLIAPLYYLDALLISPDGTKMAMAINSPNAFTKYDSTKPTLVVINLADAKKRAIEFKDNVNQISNHAGERYISWSPDSKLLVMREVRRFFSNSEQENLGDLFIVNIATGRLQNLTKGRNSSKQNSSLKVSMDVDMYPPVWSPDSSEVYVVTGGKIWSVPVELSRQITCMSESSPKGLKFYGILSPNSYYIHDGYRQFPDTITPARVVSESIYGLAATEDGTKILVEFRPNEKQHIRFSMKQKEIKVGSDLAARSGGGKVLIGGSSVISPQDLYLLDLDKNVGETLSLSPINLPASMSKRFTLQWKLVNGENADGLLLLPPRAIKGTKLPLITIMYPGQTSYAARFGYWLGGDMIFSPELLVQEGYAVFMAGLPLSGKNMLKEVADNLNPALDAAIETDYVDPDRMGVIGHSYGGYGVFCLAAQLTRFKTGVSVDGASDLISAALGSDEGPQWALGQGRMPGLLWGNETTYLANSPLFQLNKPRLPLLIVFGEKDTVYPPMGGKMMFEALKQHGVPVEYALYDGGHDPGGWRQEIQDDYWNRVVSWFNLWLKGKENMKYHYLLKTKTDWEKKLADRAATKSEVTKP